MPIKKNTEKETEHMDDDLHSIPTLSDEMIESQPEIHIDLGVIDKIVELATLDVPGVHSIASSNFLEGIISKREPRISSKDDGNDGYAIRVHVVLEFGVDLTSTAESVRVAVKAQVKRMTSKNVSRIDVFIDDVKMPVKDEKDDDDLDHPMD